MVRRRGGGSQGTKPQRNRNIGSDRQASAYERAVSLLGKDAVKKIRRDWDLWETSRGGKEWQQSEGVVMQLLQQGLSERVIRAIIPVGRSRIARLRGVLKSGVETLHTRRLSQKPSHAFSDDDIARFKEHCATWILEDGFPFAHRRPRQYFTEPKMTWKTLHAHYKDDLERESPGVRTFSYSQFLQYVRFVYPGVRFTRTAEDVCDCCVRLDILLKDPELSEEENEAILLEKKMHLDKAIVQRRFVSSFIKGYTALHAPDQRIPSQIIPDTTDDVLGDSDSYGDDTETQLATEGTDVRVQIQAEDYGGGISMPCYGHSRPSADYFNSNLSIQNFVVADISHGINNVFFYDERGQGKNADALCSLRLLYHLKTILIAASRDVQPAEISFSLLDNCVGQNKSKVVMMIFAMLSVVFPYKKVVLCFLLPGHSHNIADRVIAWCRDATRGFNLYTPMALVEKVNEVKSVRASFINHNAPDHPFFVGWGDLLSKYFTPPPAGYTANYLFEIDKGVCTARASVDTPDIDAVTYPMIDPNSTTTIRTAILSELFGSNVRSIWEASISGVRLPRHPTKELSQQKLKSLSAKYFSIPKQFINYYPDVPEVITNASTERADPAATKFGSSTPATKRRPGRPSNTRSSLRPNQPSILQFFSSDRK